MKLVVDKYVYEPPGLSIVPETEFEAAILQRYWNVPGAVELSIGKGSSGEKSANGLAYRLTFMESKAPGPKDMSNTVGSAITP